MQKLYETEEICENDENVIYRIFQELWFLMIFRYARNNETFWMIFEHCAHIKTVGFSIIILLSLTFSYFFISTSIKSYKLPISAYLLLESCQVTSNGENWDLRFGSSIPCSRIYTSQFLLVPTSFASVVKGD